jgi:hypothetical protein
MTCSFDFQSYITDRYTTEAFVLPCKKLFFENPKQNQKSKGGFEKKNTDKFNSIGQMILNCIRGDM